MADYWKSNPRFFCDICKCWMGDDKATQQIHMNGSRHKANMAQKVRDTMMRGREMAKQEKEVASSIKQMNEGALQSMMSDLARDPQLAKRYGLQLSTEATQQLQNKDSLGTKSSSSPSSSADHKPKSFSNPAPPIPPSIVEADVLQLTAEPTTMPVMGQWHKACTTDGKTYYWNSVTRESRWTDPALDFIDAITGAEVVKKEKERLNEFYEKRLKELKAAANSSPSNEEEEGAHSSVLERDEIVEATSRDDSKEDTSEDEQDTTDVPSAAPCPSLSHVTRYSLPSMSKPITEDEAALINLRRWTPVVSDDSKKLPDLGLPTLKAPDPEEQAAYAHIPEMPSDEDTEVLEIRQKSLKVTSRRPVCPSDPNNVLKVVFKKRKVENTRNFRSSQLE